MAKTRLDLQTFLETLLSSRNVYFQPPASKKLNYPCIIYKLETIQNTHADNRVYLQGTAYQIMYVTYDPDDVMIRTLSQLEGCSFDRSYTADNLNHYVYTIFY